MLGILISGKFSNKCKQSVKCIRCRLETIRKKKQAMVRYLKKDVADLISGGHDVNAFGRMDALIVEINKLSCYDMIEQYCCCILEHLPAMQKERGLTSPPSAAPSPPTIRRCSDHVLRANLKLGHPLNLRHHSLASKLRFKGFFAASLEFSSEIVAEGD